MSINCILFSVKLKNNLYRSINKQNIKTHKNIKKKKKKMLLIIDLRITFILIY